MKKSAHILIIEPSSIIREGMASIISQKNPTYTFVKKASLKEALKKEGAATFNLIIVNPLVFNHSKNLWTRFSSYFKEVNVLGLISSFYDRDFYNGFTACVFVNDSEHTILLEIEKYLTLKLENNRTNENALSDREIDVLRLLAQGKSQKEIAEELFISIHTVVTHRKNISQKLGVKSTAALVIYAVANSIIDINDSLNNPL
ncbi:MAG: hypothetical protein COB98_12015 [Flavobacteriaceae bacterium]|nr:MAG: hypothetical protein COB98_12015 [Flavobacteriaceae bacterium]